MHERTLFMVRRIPGPKSKGQGKMSDAPDEYASAPGGSEHLLIMCLGRSVTPIKKFLNTCRDFARQKREEFTSIRLCNEDWDTTVLKPIRHLETVHFDETIKAELVADIKNYLDPNTRRFYIERGIPYRRGNQL